MAILSVVKALYDYTATNADELSFTEDAVFFVLNSDDPSWWLAKEKVPADAAAKTGLVPSNYFQDFEYIDVAKVLYAYEAQTDEELTVEEGAELLIYDKDDPSWYLAKCDGKCGYVPSNYVELRSSLPMEEVAAEVDEAAAAAEEAERQFSTKEASLFNAMTSAKAAYVDPFTLYAESIQQDSTLLDSLKLYEVTDLDGKKKEKKLLATTATELLLITVDKKEKKIKARYQLSELKSATLARKNTLKADFPRISLEIEFKKGEAEVVLKALSAWIPKDHSPPKIDQAPAVKTPSFSSEPVSSSNSGAALAPTASSFSAPPVIPPSPAAKGVVTPSSSGTVATTAAPKIARASYDYQAQNDGDLTVRAGDNLIVVDDSDSEWWKVRAVSRRGGEGMVPASYVELVHALSEAEAKPSSTSFSNELASSRIGKHDVGEVGYAGTPPLSNSVPASTENLAAPGIICAKPSAKAPQVPTRPEAEQPVPQLPSRESSGQIPKLPSREPSVSFPSQPLSLPSREEPKAPQLPMREDPPVPQLPSRVEPKIPHLPSREDIKAPQLPSREDAKAPQLPSRDSKDFIKNTPPAQAPREPPVLPKASPAATTPALPAREEPKKAADTNGEIAHGEKASPVKKPEAPPARPPRDESPTKTVSAPQAGRALPTRPEKVSDKKPKPANTRVWSDRTGTFKVEAEFLGLVEDKVHLHKLNGVKIAVPLEKLSPDDLDYLEKTTGNPAVAKIKSRDSAAASAGRSDAKPNVISTTEVSYNGFDWLAFFIAAGIPSDESVSYARRCVSEKLDSSTVPDLTRELLKDLGFAEGHIIKIKKHISNRTDAPVDVSKIKEAEEKLQKQNLQMLDEKFAQKLQRQILDGDRSRDSIAVSSSAPALSAAKPPGSIGVESASADTIRLMNQMGAPPSNANASRNRGRRDGSNRSSQVPIASAIDAWAATASAVAAKDPPPAVPTSAAAPTPARTPAATPAAAAAPSRGPGPSAVAVFPNAGPAADDPWASKSAVAPATQAPESWTKVPSAHTSFPTASAAPAVSASVSAPASHPSAAISNSAAFPVSGGGGGGVAFPSSSGAGFTATTPASASAFPSTSALGSGAAASAFPSGNPFPSSASYSGSSAFPTSSTSSAFPTSSASSAFPTSSAFPSSASGFPGSAAGAPSGSAFPASNAFAPTSSAASSAFAPTPVGGPWASQPAGSNLSMLATGANPYGTPAGANPYGIPSGANPYGGSMAPTAGAPFQQQAAPTPAGGSMLRALAGRPSDAGGGYGGVSATPPSFQQTQPAPSAFPTSAAQAIAMGRPVSHVGGYGMQAPPGYNPAAAAMMQPLQPVAAPGAVLGPGPNANAALPVDPNDRYAIFKIVDPNAPSLFTQQPNPGMNPYQVNSSWGAAPPGGPFHAQGTGGYRPGY